MDEQQFTARIEEIAKRKRIPCATYRLQFNRDFTFQQAAVVADYLRELHITDCYASPLFQACAGSTHGYDICRFDRLNPNLGSEQDFDAFAGRLRELGMGLIFDMVPNHMGNEPANLWWADVLEKGPASEYALYFDIDWQPLRSDLPERILLPILEDHYWKVLESGKLRVSFEDGGFFVNYYDKQLRISPRGHGTILYLVLKGYHAKPGESSQSGVVLRELAETFSHWDRSVQKAEERLQRAKQELRELYGYCPAVRRALEAALKTLNGTPGQPHRFDRLHALLRAQHYRLAHWRVGPEEINYRHFFDIPDLVSLRMELPEVFRASHQLLFRLLREGKVTGLRVDHPDGLWDPAEYFLRVQENFLLEHLQPDAAGENALREAVRAWLQGQAGERKGAAQGSPLYLLTEKILSAGEVLPPDWPVDGTTGYDFLNCLNGLFVNANHREAFDRLYREFTGLGADFQDVVYEGKKKVLKTSLVSQINALTHRLKRVAVGSRYGRDLTFRQLHAALGEVIATFPVYRRYITEQTLEASAQDTDAVNRAITDALARNPDADPAAFEFIRDLLLLRPFEHFNERQKHRSRQFVMKFQQLTGPAMAKGLEDTAFYVHNRLVSLNEVGGDPEKFGWSAEEFHRRNASQAGLWPHALLATATHDTKRGEDVRARINVLSEMPAEWRAAVQRWQQWNAAAKSDVEGRPAPDANDEYLLYQILVGAWPPVMGGADEMKSFRERITAYMRKALREAKINTCWLEPRPAYEQAVSRFVERILDQQESRVFVDDFKPFQQRAAFFGRFNSLSQLLLKITSPGVPDVYQGTELWDFNLVDPDNRRPVDFALRRRLLAELRTEIEHEAGDLRGLVTELLAHWPSGRIKLFVLWRALTFREQHRELFDSGRYVPLTPAGEKQEHVCAFARIRDNRAVVIVAPRLVYGLTGGAEQPPTGETVWQDTFLILPEARRGAVYRNAFTHEELAVEERDGKAGLPLSKALSVCPVALLQRVG